MVVFGGLANCAHHPKNAEAVLAGPHWEAYQQGYAKQNSASGVSTVDYGYVSESRSFDDFSRDASWSVGVDGSMPAVPKRISCDGHVSVATCDVFDPPETP